MESSHRKDVQHQREGEEVKLLFATQNEHKLQEVRAIIGSYIQIIGLNEFHFHQELPETHSTLKGNAEEKAQFIFKKFHTNCFAEDTGLEIAVLNGEPGVLSARYAGEKKNASGNIRLVLERLSGGKNRSAQFRTVICLVLDGKNFFFEGITGGEIATTPFGTSGFGYDPIFIPDGYSKTFAEIPYGEKNTISHRYKAILAMSDFLSRYQQ